MAPRRSVAPKARAPRTPPPPKAVAQTRQHGATLMDMLRAQVKGEEEEPRQPNAAEKEDNDNTSAPDKEPTPSHTEKQDFKSHEHDGVDPSNTIIDELTPPTSPKPAEPESGSSSVWATCAQPRDEAEYDVERFVQMNLVEAAKPGKEVTEHFEESLQHLAKEARSEEAKGGSTSADSTDDPFEKMLEEAVASPNGFSLRQSLGQRFARCTKEGTTLGEEYRAI